MKENEVLAFLEANPEFLEAHAPQFGLRPSLERVISLSERQLLETRDKLRIQENRFAELVEIAKANENILHAMQQLTLVLLGISSIDDIQTRLAHALSHHFGLDRAVLHLWHPAAEKNNCYHLPGTECTQYLHTLSQPTCTHFLQKEMIEWFPAQPVLQSFAIIPLFCGNDQPCGVLVLGSHEAERFQPSKQTDFLNILATQLNALLTRLIDTQEVAAG